MELTGSRLTLKPIVWADLDHIHKLHALPETDAYNALGIPKNMEVTKAIIKPWIEENLKPSIQNYTYAITLTESSQFIGLIALKLGAEKYKRAEVWYKLHKDSWGNGFGTEALQILIHFGFSKLHLHRIEAGCAVGNLASIRVLEKVGMTKEGRKRKVLPLKSGWSDNFEFAILEEDFDNSK